MKHLIISLFFYLIVICAFVIYDLIYAKIFATVILSCPIFLLFLTIYRLICESDIFEYVRYKHPEFNEKYPPSRDYFNFSKSFNYIDISKEDMNLIMDESIKDKIVFLMHFLLFAFVSIFSLVIIVGIFLVIKY